VIRRPLLALALLIAGCGGGDTGARPAVFQVVSRPNEVATAFALGADRAVTVAHVLEGPVVRLQDGRRATVRSVDQVNDLAVLSVPGLHAPRTHLGSASGNVVVLVVRRGHVKALPAHIRRAINARIRTPDGTRVVRRRALELAADVAPGDSGAPVVTGDGRVVGVVFAQASRRADTAYAVNALAALPRPPAGRS
jgi:S1-C subfamily serine protease